MRLKTFSTSAFFALASLLAFGHVSSSTRAHSLEKRVSCNSDGLCNSGTTAVQWDKQNLIIQGQRVLVWSGEVHFWRLPVPDLWRDILQKMKAAGFNAVSAYVHWGVTNPTEGKVEFDGYRDFELFIKIAQEVGLWVIARPGPYINAETSGGGIPGRVTNIGGFLRSNDTDYYASYQDYFRGVANIVKKHQINEGGPVILFQVENEYTNNTNYATNNPVTKSEYMQALEDILHELGIFLPLISNDSYQGKNFAPGSGTGAVDIYGLDSYPQGGCDQPYSWSTYPVDNWNYHQSTNPNQVWITPEFQGGSILGWGPGSPTYDQCRILTGPDFEQVYYLNNIATGIRVQNTYMTYGGTNWGFIAYPGGYTSYDYGASIAEDRSLTDKWFELKNIGLLFRSVADDLPAAVNVSAIADPTKPPQGYTDDSTIYVTELRNSASNAGFYIVRHVQTSSSETTKFKVNISTSAGQFTVPQTSNTFITLDGRQSRLLVTDHKYGHSNILYSTASLFYSGTIGSRDVVFLHGPSGQSFEVVIKAGSDSLNFTGSLAVNVTASADGYILLTFSPSQGQLATAVTNNTVIILGDTSSAAAFHSPIIPGKEGSTFFGISSNQTVLLNGPHLVRNVTLDASGSSLSLVGDTNTTSPKTITVYAPEKVTRLSWNGKDVRSTVLAPGILTFQSPGISKVPSQPALSRWKYANGLPEVVKGYDDSKWLNADKESSTNPFGKYYGQYYLYACEYGFCEGPVLWRGHFKSDGAESAVNLSISGGRAFVGSVWLNDAFLGSTYGNSSNNKDSVIVETTNQTYAFPDGALLKGADNVITVLHDNMGLEEARANQYPEWIKSPRGIQGYYLLNSTSQPTWKVQGKLGGYSNFPDRARGIMNEGGTFGERAGWHLPGFDDSSWESRSIHDGISTAGVGFFRTTFRLNIDRGLDVIMSFNFPPYGVGTYRAFLYVNGWNMGRYVANLGPQSRFPVPAGILNYSGENSVAIILWAPSSTGAKIESFDVTIDSVIAGGVGAVTPNNPGWSKRDSF